MSEAANDDFRVRGVGRDCENERVLCLYLNRRPTDDEMRRIHELLREGIPAPATSKDQS